MSHPEYPTAYECKHCHQPAGETIHVGGSRDHLQRCDASAYGLDYGYNAHPIETPCDNKWTACVGSIRPDPNYINKES